MPLNGEAVQNAALDAVVASLPTGGTWRLYSDLPTEAGTELPSDGGYAPVAATGSEWSAATGTSKSFTVTVGTSTGAYGEVGTYWAYCDSSGAVVLWDEPDQPVEVPAAGAVVSFSGSIAFVDPT